MATGNYKTNDENDNKNGYSPKFVIKKPHQQQPPVNPKKLYRPTE